MRQFFPSIILDQTLMLLFPTTITSKKSQLSLLFNNVQILNIIGYWQARNGSDRLVLAWPLQSFFLHPESLELATLDFKFILGNTFWQSDSLLCQVNDRMVLKDYWVFETCWPRCEDTSNSEIRTCKNITEYTIGIFLLYLLLLS